MRLSFAKFEQNFAWLIALALAACSLSPAPTTGSIKSACAQSIKSQPTSFENDGFHLVPLPAEFVSVLDDEDYWSRFAENLADPAPYAVLNSQPEGRARFRKAIISFVLPHRGNKEMVNLSLRLAAQEDMPSTAIPTTPQPPILTPPLAPPLQTLGGDYYNWIACHAQAIFEGSPHVRPAFRGHRVFVAAKKRSNLDMREDRAIHSGKPKILSAYLALSSEIRLWFEDRRGTSGQESAGEEIRPHDGDDNLYRFDGIPGSEVGIHPDGFDRSFQKWVRVPRYHVLFAAPHLRHMIAPGEAGDTHSVTTFKQANGRCE